MSQVKNFLENQMIKHLYINTSINQQGVKILDTTTAPTGPNELKKSYEVLTIANRQRQDYNTIAIDTKNFHQLDCDNEEVFNKYFGHLNLKENTPYYLSLNKKLPHYFINLVNLPNGLNTRKGLKYGSDTFADVLIGQWAWCSMDEILHNTDKPIYIMDYNDIQNIHDKSQNDFKEQLKNQKLQVKTEKEKLKDLERKQKREIRELKKAKPERSTKGQEQLRLLLNRNKIDSISRKDQLLLELLPREMADDRDIWVSVGYVIHDLHKNNYEAGLKRFKRFSALSDKYEPDKIEEQYKSFKNSRQEITIGTVHHHLKQTNEGLYTIYKIVCKCFDFKFRDQDLANMFYQEFKDTYVCAYFNPKDCWYEYEDGMYHELDGAAIIAALVPELGEKILNSVAALTYVTQIYKDLEEKSDYSDPDIKYFIESGVYYKDLLDLACKADDYCNDAKGQENIYKCCKVLFYKRDFLSRLNKCIHLLGFGNDVLDTSLITEDSTIEDIFRESTREDYISIKTGMTKEQCLQADEDITIFLNKKNKLVGKRAKTTKDYLGEYDSYAEKYLKVALPHEGQYEYMLTLLSDSIYGKNRQRFCINMGVGKNMKSVLQMLMQKGFGDYFGTMKPGFITAKDDDKSSSADSDLYSCMYKRSLWISEPPENKTLNGSKMKLLAGNDVIKVREIYKKAEEFIPQFSIYINCNTTFKLDPCSDLSLPRRIKFNKFTQYFTNNVDPNNPSHSKEDPLIKDEQFTTLLARSLMKVLIGHYIKIENIDPTHEVEDTEPTICLGWKKEFIASGDSFEDFFDDGYELTKDINDIIFNAQFYYDYVQYCKSNQYKAVNKSLFFGKIQLKFPNPKLYCSSLKTLGIKMKDIVDTKTPEILVPIDNMDPKANQIRSKIENVRPKVVTLKSLMESKPKKHMFDSDDEDN